MRNEQELLPDTQNSSALGNISVLSPSQRRERERMRQEKEAKDAAEKEKRRIAAAKRKAAEEAANKEMRRKEIISRIPFAIIKALIMFIVIGILSAVILFFVSLFINSENPHLSIVRYCFYFGGMAALWFFSNDMRNQ